MQVLARFEDRQPFAYSRDRREYRRVADDVAWAHEEDGLLRSARSGRPLAFRVGSFYLETETLAVLYFASDDLALFAVRQGGERRQWETLVPERDGGDVVLELQVTPASPPAECLHRDGQVAAETDGIGEMPAVQAEPLLRAVRTVGT